MVLKPQKAHLSATHLKSNHSTADALQVTFCIYVLKLESQTFYLDVNPSFCPKYLVGSSAWIKYRHLHTLFAVF